MDIYFCKIVICPDLPDKIKIGNKFNTHIRLNIRLWNEQ